MSATSTIRVPTDIAERRSTVRLIAIAGVQGFASWIMVQARIATENPDGDTSRWTLVDWGALSKWPGDPRVFLAALVEAELVVPVAGGWRPALWHEEQPHLVHAKARSAVAQKNAQARWNRFLQPELALDASRTQPACDPQCETEPGSNARPVSSRLDSYRSESEGQTPVAPFGAPGLALPPPGSVPPPFHAPSWGESVRVVAERLGEVLRALEEHDKPELDPVARRRYESTHASLLQFDDPEFWTAIDQWLGGDDSRVFYLDEFKKFWAWHVARPLSQRRRSMKAAFRNWLSTSERWKERDAQREEIRRTENPRRRR